MKKNASVEFQNFDDTMTRLLSVTHRQIKEKLDAEKAAKSNKGEGKKRGKREAKG